MDKKNAFIDITGQRFENLVVIGFFGTKDDHAFWMCKCDCGNEKPIRGTRLRSGNAHNCGWHCGCPSVKRKGRGGMKSRGGRVFSSEPLYYVWIAMRQRCENPKHKMYGYYGGRGITICSGWKNSVENFIIDMGVRPDGYSIDRINNDDGYHCGHCEECITNDWVANCRWATRKEQQNNRRSYQKRK